MKNDFKIYKFKISINKIENSKNLSCGFLEKNLKDYNNIQKHGVPKVYILKFYNKIQYVGTTIQKQSTRLWQGLNGKYSYKWNELINQELTLIVVCFNINCIEFNEKGEKYIETYKSKIEESSKYNKNMNLKVELEKEKKKQFIENIEAELVFNLRKSDSNEIWSDYQHEIHFNNFFDTGKLIAINIYSEIIINSNE